MENKALAGLIGAFATAITVRREIGKEIVLERKGYEGV